MQLSQIVRKECIETGVSPSDKGDALRLVARAAKKSPLFDNLTEDDILQGLEEREAMGSTGFGDGIAIPHCRLTGAREFAVGIITVPGGVEFDALDDKPVKLMIFIVGPYRETNEHIRILSMISRTLHIPGVIAELESQTSTEGVLESFLRSTEDHIETGDKKERQLFHVFIQNDRIFEDILQVFASMDTCSMAIVEGKNSREYLGSIPLFAGFWGDSHYGINRIITAVVDKSFANETIRAIERITGNLDNREDVLLIVQDIFYTTGSLEP